MKALALMLVFALPAAAQDAPLVGTESLAVQLKQGEVAPVDGLLLPDASAIAAAKRLAAAEATATEATTALKSQPSTAMLIVGAVIVLGLGFAAGFATREATTKK